MSPASPSSSERGSFFSRPFCETSKATHATRSIPAEIPALGSTRHTRFLPAVSRPSTQSAVATLRVTGFPGFHRPEAACSA